MNYPPKTKDLVRQHVIDAASKGRRLTCRELADLCGCRSTSSVHRHLQKLYRQNLLPEIGYQPKPRAEDLFDRVAVDPDSRCGKTVIGITAALELLRAGSTAAAAKTLQGLLSWLPAVRRKPAPSRSVAS